MTSQGNTATINLKFFHYRISSDLDSHLVALQSTLRSIKDGTYSSSQMNNIGIMKMAMLIPDPETLKKKEINKCFKACVGSLQDFMDSLIGAINMCKSDIRSSKALSGKEEIEKFLQETQDKFIQDVARNKSLKVKDKLDLLQVTEPTIRKMVDGYFSTRNSIEHHKSFADRDVELVYREFKLLAGDMEIKTLPSQGSKNTGISMGAKDTIRVISKDSLIEISETEIENVIQSIKIFIATYMTQKAQEIINTRALNN